MSVPLARPTVLSPKNRGTGIPSISALNWKDVTGASSYTVQVAMDSKFTNVVASMSGLTASQWTVTSALAGNTKYFWRAMSVNDCGPGPLSATWPHGVLPLNLNPPKVLSPFLIREGERASGRLPLDA